MRTRREYRHSEQGPISGADIVSRARLDSQANDELFGRCVGETMKDLGVSFDDLARKLSLINKKITTHDLSHLIQGQIVFCLSQDAKRDICWALGLVENRGDADNLSHEDLDALVQPKNPRQLGMTL